MSTLNRAIMQLKILEVITRRIIALIRFLETYRATASDPWTDGDADEHQRLLVLWRQSLKDLNAFERPNPIL
jgi:hypothetical protein